MAGKAALITGGSARLGATTARLLHAAGAQLVIHYRNSASKATALQAELNAVRPASVALLQGDLLDHAGLPGLARDAIAAHGRLDLLVNNASTYYPTEIGTATGEQWDDLFGTNVRAPFFLAQALAPELRNRGGCIVNLVDIHGLRPNLGFPIYSMAKAANAMMVQSLARELAPEIRVNGVAPGAILWPEGAHGEVSANRNLPRIPLGRAGSPQDIARAVLYLATADYVTGQILCVDGGRTVQQ